jgi:hypothetical protein
MTVIVLDSACGKNRSLNPKGVRAENKKGSEPMALTPKPTAKGVRADGSDP